MALSKRLRRWVSGVLAMTVLFTQVTLAAYVCPPGQGTPHEHAAAMASMPDCHSAGGPVDEVQPQLCKAHCTGDVQSSARTISPDLQPNPASVALLQRVIEPADPVPFAYLVGRVAPLTDPPDPLPLYLSLLVLRN